MLEDIVVALVLTFLADRTGYAGFAASLVLAATYLAAARFLALLLVRHMAALSDELALLSAFAATVGTAMLFACLDASGAVGAFLCGVVSAGLGFRDCVERLVGPVRSLAVAFFAVGAQAVGILSALTGLAVALSLAALAVKIPLGYQAGRTAELGPRPARTASLLLLPRGEVNLVIAALALPAAGGALVAQLAVLTVLVSIPVGSMLARYAPELPALFERGAARHRRADARSRSPDAVA